MPAAAAGCDQSLQSLVNGAPPRSALYVPACVYREEVFIGKPLTLVGQPGAEIRGSDVWTNWVPSAGLWVSAQSVPLLPVVSVDPHACGADDGCLSPEQVFIDGVPLSTVPANQNPSPGEFALDGNRHVILADDPTSHMVEVTTRSRWIITGADGVTIQGMTMREAGNSALAGALSNDGFSNWTLVDSTLSDAHAADVSLDGGVGVRVLRSDIAGAGLSGIAGNGILEGGLVQGNRIHDNRTAAAGFSRNWGAGGLKVTNVHSFVVDGNEVDHNDAAGLWCDGACRDVTFSNNRVHHNQWMGLNFEISDGASIHDNTFWENGWGFTSYGWGAGIVISSSANAEVYNNTVAWNYAGISVIWQNRPDSPGPNPVGNYVHDNAIFKKTVLGDFSQTFWSNLSLAWLGDNSAPFYAPASQNQGVANLVWYDQPESQTVRFTWTEQYFNLSQFVDRPGGIRTRYMTDEEKDEILAEHEVPAAPERG